jgi:glycolate dehydrogenase FAD-binding subunit
LITLLRDGNSDFMPDADPSPGEFSPISQSELCRFLRENADGERRAVVPVGGRTALHYGYPVREAVIVDTTSLSRIVDYPARDMTVTVEAGLRFDELAELLSGERQQLPIDVPQSNRATLGGVIATTVSGSRRFGYGTLRDYVIGISAVDAGGRLFKAGGRVVKNVAGYDLCKLLVGSLGTLAVITQVTLKLKPIPESSALLWATFPDLPTVDRVLERLLTSAARPVIVDVLTAASARQVAAGIRSGLSADRPVLVLGVDGGERETNWQVETLKTELAAESPTSVDVLSTDDRGRLLSALTEFSVHSEEPLIFRASLPPSQTIAFLEQAERAGVALHSHAGNGIVTGLLPEDVSGVEEAARLLSPLMDAVRQQRGGFTILHCAEAWKGRLPVFGRDVSGQELMRRVKSELDPHGLLNPGRLFGA